MSGPGALVLIGTPIGNLDDISPRAVAELARADVIACEDTRRTGRLLVHVGVEKRLLVTVNDHTEAGRIGDLLGRIRRGERVALVSDAGMPAISDPGERLVRAAVSDGLTVEVIPGPSAGIAAIVGSGLPTGRFCFEGFLPRKGSGRTERLRSLRSEQRTMILYESPHRLARTLSDLVEAFGSQRRVAIGRELTKLHEEFVRLTLGEAVGWAEGSEPRGEIVLVVDGAPPPDALGCDDVESLVRAALDAGGSVKEVAGDLSVQLGIPKREVYDIALALKRAMVTGQAGE